MRRDVTWNSKAANCPCITSGSAHKAGSRAFGQSIEATFAGSDLSFTPILGHLERRIAREGIMNTSFARALIFSFSIAGPVLLSEAARSQAIFRTEVHPVQTVTLGTADYLLGKKDGKPVTIAGELRIPKPGTGRLPAVVLVHGAGGINFNHGMWAGELNKAGFATFVVDGFTGRGITNTISDQAQLSDYAMMYDAFAALAVLVKHPRVDPGKIAIMGFSKGAVASLYASLNRFQ